MKKNLNYDSPRFKGRVGKILIKIKLITCLLTLIAFAANVNAFAQQQRVTGRVTDGTTSEPLAGVTIQVQGTMTGAISQADGTYNVTVPQGGTTLIFSFIGYQSQKFPYREGR